MEQVVIEKPKVKVILDCGEYVLNKLNQGQLEEIQKTAKKEGEKITPEEGAAIMAQLTKTLTEIGLPEEVQKKLTNDEQEQIITFCTTPSKKK